MKNVIEDLFLFILPFFLGFCACVILVAIAGGLEHHRKPYTIVQESFTNEEKKYCRTDDNCIDILLFSDLPQRIDNKQFLKINLNNGRTSFRVKNFCKFKKCRKMGF